VSAGLLLTGTTLAAFLAERFKSELAVQSLRAKGVGFTSIKNGLHENPPAPGSLPACPDPSASLPPHTSPVDSKGKELPGLIGSGNPVVMEHTAAPDNDVSELPVRKKEREREMARLRKAKQRRLDAEKKRKANAEPAPAQGSGKKKRGRGRPSSKKK
jgi:hypothetical protein